MLVWFHTLFSTRPPFVTSICFSAFFKRMKNWDIFFPSIKEFFAVIAFDSFRFVLCTENKVFFQLLSRSQPLHRRQFFQPAKFFVARGSENLSFFLLASLKKCSSFFLSLSRAQEWDWLNVERGRVRRRVQVLYVSEKGSLVTVGGGEGARRLPSMERERDLKNKALHASPEGIHQRYVCLIPLSLSPSRFPPPLQLSTSLHLPLPELPLASLSSDSPLAHSLPCSSSFIIVEGWVYERRECQARQTFSQEWEKGEREFEERRSGGR